MRVWHFSIGSAGLGFVTWVLAETKEEARVLVLGKAPMFYRTWMQNLLKEGDDFLVESWPVDETGHLLTEELG